MADIKDKGMSNKEKALDGALAQIEKQFGKGAVMKLCLLYTSRCV